MNLLTHPNHLIDAVAIRKANAEGYTLSNTISAVRALCKQGFTAPEHLPYGGIYTPTPEQGEVVDLAPWGRVAMSNPRQWWFETNYLLLFPGVREKVAAKLGVAMSPHYHQLFDMAVQAVRNVDGF